MKLIVKWNTVFAVGLISAFQTMAQQPPMQVPMTPQAIESHLEQKRTQEQREAIEAKKSQAATAAAPAASDCEAKAIGKNGKPLAGAAKASFIKKCAADAKSKAIASDCEAKAVSKDGKPLAGADKAASIKKCEKDAKGSK